MHSDNIFKAIYRGMQEAVVVCKDDEQHILVYANYPAVTLLDPAHKIDLSRITEYPLAALLNSLEIELESFFNKLKVEQVAYELPLVVLDTDGMRKQIVLSANQTYLGDERYFVFYLKETDETALDENRYYRIMSFIYEIASYTEDYNETIQNILGICGSATKVSRAYIIEPGLKDTCSNTYEWCDVGVMPMKDELQNMDRTAYDYEFFANSQDVVIRTIGYMGEGKERRILESQGIKGLVMMPITYHGVSVGYMGFDDCEAERDWDAMEIGLLRSVASILASLIMRRDERRRSDRTLAVMQRVTDSIGNPILVNTLDTYEILFVNEAMRKSLLRNPRIRNGNIIGEKCYYVMHPEGDEICPGCPLESFKNINQEYVGGSSYREYFSVYTNQWFAVHDSIVEWTDGQLVHIESGLEITRQKENEEKLLKLASTDSMTGIYSRVWGYKILQEAAAEPSQEPKSLVFIDLDGLKLVNDTLGHSVGDEMITVFAKMMREGLDETSKIIRWGGDEFIVLMNSSAEQAETMIEKIQEDMERFNSVSGKAYRIEFSHGVVDFLPESKKVLDQLITTADQKMYEKKVLRKQVRTI